MSNPDLQVQLHGPQQQVAIVRLTRPSKRNALNDGLIGNKAVINTLGYLTTAVFNYMRSQNAPAYSLQNILGIMHDYIYKPLTDEEKRQLANQRLLEFMTMKHDAPDLLKR